MLLKKEINENYLNDWPLHYYDIQDIDEREAVLKEILRQNPQSQDDLIRMDLFQKRYGGNTGKKRADAFMHGWMMIRISSPEKISFLNRKSKEKELRKNLKELCVLDTECTDILKDEWHDFAECWIHTCIDSSAYRSTLFGMVSTSEKNIALRMADDIDIITRTLPAEFNLEEECRPFREVLISTYKEMLDHGESYWADYLASK